MINDSIWANDEWSDTVTADKAETSWIDDMVNGMNEAVSFDDAFDEEVVKTREEVRAELDAKAAKEFARKGGSTVGLFSAEFQRTIDAYKKASFKECFDAYVATLDGAMTEFAGICYAKAFAAAYKYVSTISGYGSTAYFSEKARDLAGAATVEMIELAKADKVRNPMAIVWLVDSKTKDLAKREFRDADYLKKALTKFKATYGITDNGEDIWVSSAVTGIEATDHYDPYFDLYVAIGELDAKDRDAVIACYFNGMTTREYSLLIGKSSKTVVVRALDRAREKLGSVLS